jgi:CBS domain-containing membrane protein
MSDEQKGNDFVPPLRLDLTDRDILEAMKSVPGYLDITPADFKEIYRQAFQQALERLSRSVTARDMMTQEVVRVKSATSVVEVAEVMAEKGISGLPVVNDEDQVLGIISEKNFLSRLGENTHQNVMGVIAQCLQVKKCLALSLGGQKAQDIMSFPAITIGLDTPLQEIARIFSSKGINRAPVIDSNNRLLGIVSRGDMFKAEGWWIK